MVHLTKKKIVLLAAPDLADDARNTVRLATEQTGAELIEAGSADEAASMAENNAAAAVICDSALGDAALLDLISKIRESALSPRPIVLIDQNDVETVRSALAAGIRQFVVKPPAAGPLEASLAQCLAPGVAEAAGAKELIYRLPNMMSVVPGFTEMMSRETANACGFGAEAVQEVRTALQEMTYNAIEHGNLAITFAEKSRLTESPNDLREEIDRRAASPELRDRRVTIRARYDPDQVTFRITDEGRGFDRSNLSDPTQNVELFHGRGIVLARAFMDEVAYSESGNEVTIIRRRSSSTAESV